MLQTTKLWFIIWSWHLELQVVVFQVKMITSVMRKMMSYMGFCNQLFKNWFCFCFKKTTKGIVKEMEPLNAGLDNFRKFRSSTE